jgi:hypothetical protein
MKLQWDILTLTAHCVITTDDVSVETFTCTVALLQDYQAFGLQVYIFIAFTNLIHFTHRGLPKCQKNILT